MSKNSKKRTNAKKISTNAVNKAAAAPATEETKVTERVTETTTAEETVETVVEEDAFNEDAMFTDEPVDRIETIDPVEYKKALRKRFFMDGVSMEKYKSFINTVSFGILSEETVAGIATLLFEQIKEEDKTSYNMKAVEAFIKFGLMGRMESANAYLPDEDECELINKLNLNIDQLTNIQDMILENQLTNMLINFFGLVFAKPIQVENAAKAKAKADKAAEKAEKKAAKDAAKASKKEAKSQETEEESEPTEKKENLGDKLKNKMKEAKEKAAAKKQAKANQKETKEAVEDSDETSDEVEFDCEEESAS